MLFDTEVVKQCVELRAVPNHLAGLRESELRAQVLVRNEETPLVGRFFLAQALEGRGLARPCNTQKRKTLSEIQRKRKPVDCFGERGIALG